ncbi:MAG: hypothetical protein JSV81_03110, partial [Anaerolineales bacterium]
MASGYPPALAQSPPPALYVFPTQAAPGADLYLSAFGLDSGVQYQLVIDNPPDPGLFSLDFVQTDRNGQFQVARTLPALTPGLHLISVVELIDYSILASAPVEVLPPLDLALSPTSGVPGTEVDFTVTNLLTGTLRLDYAGLPVLGPLAVGAGSYSGNFRLPGDRPDPLGGLTSVTALNLVGNRVVGKAEASFQSQEPSPSPTYSL